ncbi:hypothetical protein NPIL_175461 [Nephila pilipes]|uniref:Uncharacterized protein n=1 Tax=Nephila pilipes TaxID=299642 RepID=A0A8X6QFN5_NEPPI|nr:hypothetical protein NPIL_175461 [Nephila pilipes]
MVAIKTIKKSEKKPNIHTSAPSLNFGRNAPPFAPARRQTLRRVALALQTYQPPIGRSVTAPAPYKARARCQSLSKKVSVFCRFYLQQTISTVSSVERRTTLDTAFFCS